MKQSSFYDMPIVQVWPDFGAHGKQDATLRMALAHQTGVPQTPVGYTPEWLPDWERMCRGIADLTPMFPPGERTAYHSLNFGYINGEIRRRVDGRTIAQFLQEEICAPLGIDGAYLGVPESQLVLGKHSGRHALGKRCEALGYSLMREQLDEVYNRFIALADRQKGVMDHEIGEIAAQVTGRGEPAVDELTEFVYEPLRSRREAGSR